MRAHAARRCKLRAPAFALAFRREIDNVSGDAVDATAHITMEDGSSVEVAVHAIEQVKPSRPASMAASFCEHVVWIEPTTTGIRFEFGDETRLGIELDPNYGEAE